MSMFTLATSCFTISDLPWFMDLTFQVPMQYCFSQHCTLLLSPVTSTTGCCFCFGSVSSFFLELFLHWSPVAYWAPTDLGSSSFSVLSFCLFNKMVILFNILREHHTVFAQWRYHFTFSPTVHKSSIFSTSLPALVFCFDDSYLSLCEVISHCGFHLYFLI